MPQIEHASSTTTTTGRRPTFEEEEKEEELVIEIVLARHPSIALSLFLVVIVAYFK